MRRVSVRLPLAAAAVVALLLFGWTPGADAPAATRRPHRAARPARPVARTTTTTTTTTTLPPAAAPTTLAPPASTISPQAYLDRVLAFMERNTARAGSVDVPAIVATARRRGADVTELAATHPIIRDALASLGDRHSALLDPKAAASFLRGQSTGFGFRVYPPDVIWLVPGSPAEAAGIRNLDRLQTLNGKAFAQTTAADRMAPVAAIAVTRDGQPLQFTVTRGALVTAERPSVRALGDRLGYVDLPGATGDRQAETAFARAGLDGIRGVEQAIRPCGWVVDLRRNSGGFPFSMLSVLEPFLGSGPFLGFAYGGGDRDDVAFADGILRVGTSTVWSTPDPVRLGAPDVPVALLTSPTTASAGEAAVISFIGRPHSATFGEATTGVTSANVGINLPDGAFVMVTHSYDLDRGGKLYDGPLVPDVALATDWTVFATATDPVLNAARAWLDAQPACISR